MSTSFKVRITNGTNQTIIGDDDDLLLVKPLTARWFNSNWESATGLYLVSQDDETVGQIAPDGYGLDVCLSYHRKMLEKVMNECGRLNREGYEGGFTANRSDVAAIRAGVIPHEAFEFLELLHRAIRLMEMFEALGLNEVHVTVFWS